MGLKRYRATGMKVLSSLLLFAGTAAASDSSAQRLAVVVPAHAGDLSRAVSALDRWPRECSPVTKDNVDLVLYYAEGEDDSGPTAALDEITTSAGRCFSNTRLVYANLNEEVSAQDNRARDIHAPGQEQARTGELKGDWPHCLDPVCAAGARPCSRFCHDDRMRSFHICSENFQAFFATEAAYSSSTPKVAPPCSMFLSSSPRCASRRTAIIVKIRAPQVYV